VPLASTRTPKFTYYFFRKSIFPSWEEPRNKNGGTFQFVVCDIARGNTDKELANDVWHLVLLGLVGETLAEASIVNGACLKLRKSTTIEFWTSVCNQKQITAFVTSVKDLLAKRLSAFPVRQLEGLEFTSNHTNIIKSNPAAAVNQQQPSGSPTSPHPNHGGKNNKNNNNNMHSLPPPPPPPPSGIDFKI
jgi:hypothetical protein